MGLEWDSRIVHPRDPRDLVSRFAASKPVKTSHMRISRRLRAIYHLQTTLLEIRQRLMQFDEFWNRIWSPIENRKKMSEASMSGSMNDESGHVGRATNKRWLGSELRSL
jgi:hypothetical protein